MNRSAWSAPKLTILDSGLETAKAGANTEFTNPSGLVMGSPVVDDPEDDLNGSS